MPTPTPSRLLAALAVAVALQCRPAAGAPPVPPRPTAMFPVEFADTSGEAPRPGRDAQVAATTAGLADLLAGSGRYRAVDLAPVRGRLAAAGPLHRCGGCWVDLAREAGAEVAAVTVVHKMSTLVSSMRVWVVDVATRHVVREGAVSLRGDDDEAWRRAARYLARNVLLDEGRARPSLSSPFPGG